VGYKLGIAQSYDQIGMIALCQGEWEGAVDAFEKAYQIFQEIGKGYRQSMVSMPCRLGQAHLAQGDRDEAMTRFREALAVMEPETWKGYLGSYFGGDFTNRSLIANTLSGLEAAYDDDDAFRTLCRRFQQEHLGAGDGPLVQWFLEPAVGGAVGSKLQGSEPPLHHDDFGTTLSPEWTWEDPFDDCSFTVGDGLEIHAPNGRGLWHINLSAPRLLRPVEVDWAAQTVCVPVSGPAPGEEKPTIGGLLLWKDKDNFLRLDQGAYGERDVFFGGYLENQGMVIGRGRLPLGSSKRVFLRLERTGDRVDAYCSADGKDWFAVGHVDFPVEDPLQIGLHAIGDIDRTVYHGSYPDGTAIRFESFQLWGSGANEPE
jgi:hypothetical protein